MGYSRLSELNKTNSEYSSQLAPYDEILEDLKIKKD